MPGKKSERENIDVAIRGGGSAVLVIRKGYMCACATPVERIRRRKKVRERTITEFLKELEEEEKKKKKKKNETTNDH